MKPLTRVARAARNREQAGTEWRAAIREAREQGETVRAIAKAAGISHVRVLQLLRD